MEMFLPASKIVISYSNIDGVTRTNDTKTISNVDLKRVNNEIKKLTWWRNEQQSRPTVFQSRLHRTGTDSTS